MATNNGINLKDSGLASYDGAGTFAGRTITQPAAGITVADGDGISGNPTLALADDLAAIEGLSGSGVITRTGASAWSTNTIADRAVVVGDTGNTVQGIGPLADGELLIGATGGAPAAATLTAGTGIDVTNATNSVTIDFDVTEVTAIPTSFPTDTGTATPAANAVTFAGSGGIATSGAGATVTIDGSGITGGIATAAGDSGTATGSTVSWAGGTGITTSATGSTVTINMDTPVTVANGGTGRGTATAYAVLAGGTTATGAHQSISSVGTSGQILTSNGAGALPTFQAEALAIGVKNLGIAYNGGTGVFTVQGADASLSSSNVATVTIPSKTTPGELLKIDVSSDQSFIDDVGSSEIIGNLFGCTTSVAWGNNCPFFIYAVLNNNEDAISFMISRIPHASVSPASSSIGQPGSAIADTMYSFFSIDSITATDWDANPCICIGSFKMTMSASDDWTVTTLDDYDGIGKFQEGVLFDMVLGQYGASSGTFMKPNGGTAPVFTNNNYQYSISKDGMCHSLWDLSGDGGTDGSGSVSAELTMPLAADSILDGYYVGSGLIVNPFWTRICVHQINSAPDIHFISEASSGATLENSAFTNGTRFLRGFIIFPIVNT